ncbi:hypothetical protein HOA64_00380 [bacterium]|jgi:hypothetical protein|nr:hypothetical protein [bacterium]MBT6831496.1 hypothetical protein [bacterium]
MIFRRKNLRKKITSALALFSLCFSAFSPTALAFSWPWESAPDAEISFQSPPEIERVKIVSVLVANSLLDRGELFTAIERYAMDVQKKLNARVVLIPVPEDADVFEIAEGNAHLFFSGIENDNRSQLIGTVLIGDVPFPVVDKNGRSWPTIFPYVDFENKNYEWDFEKSQFVWQSGDNEPEIWHGVIRSDADSDDARAHEILQFLQRNHLVHEEKTEFPKKVLFVDLPRQREGLSPELLQQYQNWIDHVDDIMYLRFNKHWAQELFGDIDLEELVPPEILDEELRPTESTAVSFGGIPDVHAKGVIDNLTKRYFEAARNRIEEFNTWILRTGRWQPSDVDTTFSLVARKDQWAAELLKNANDAIEDTLWNYVETQNLDKDLIVPTKEKFAYATPLPIPPFFAVARRYEKDLYWNGIRRSEMDSAEDCTLLRGTPRTTDFPIAQMVEANRSYNFSTADPELSRPEEDCVDWDGDDTQPKDQKADIFEGCCAMNTDINSDTFEMSNGDCDTGSEWDTWPCVLTRNGTCYVSPAPPYNSIHRLAGAWEHFGATSPVFDIAGTREVFAGFRGASGCSQILVLEEKAGETKTFSSLMKHDEPRIETIQTQLSEMSTNSIPVDDPRGFSFYDLGDQFQYVVFPDLFEFFPQNLTDENLETQIWALLKSKISEVNGIVEDANLISNENLVDELENFGLESGRTMESEISAAVVDRHATDYSQITGWNTTQFPEIYLQTVFSVGSTFLKIWGKIEDPNNSGAELPILLATTGDVSGGAGIFSIAAQNSSGWGGSIVLDSVPEIGETWEYEYDPYVFDFSQITGWDTAAVPKLFLKFVENAAEENFLKIYASDSDRENDTNLLAQIGDVSVQIDASGNVTSGGPGQTFPVSAQNSSGWGGTIFLGELPEIGTEWEFQMNFLNPRTDLLKRFRVGTENFTAQFPASSTEFSDEISTGNFAIQTCFDSARAAACTTWSGGGCATYNFTTTIANNLETCLIATNDNLKNSISVASGNALENFSTDFSTEISALETELDENLSDFSTILEPQFSSLENVLDATDSIFQNRVISYVSLSFLQQQKSEIQAEKIAAQSFTSAYKTDYISALNFEEIALDLLISQKNSSTDLSAQFPDFNEKLERLRENLLAFKFRVLKIQTIELPELFDEKTAGISALETNLNLAETEISDTISTKYSAVNALAITASLISTIADANQLETDVLLEFQNFDDAITDTGGDLPTFQSELLTQIATNQENLETLETAIDDFGTIVSAWDVVAGFDDDCEYFDVAATISGDADVSISYDRDCGFGKFSHAKKFKMGATIAETVFDDVFSELGFDEVIDAIQWLGEDLETKNIEVLIAALSDDATGRSVLKNPDFHGYEIIEIIGKESDTIPGGSVGVAFERGSELPTNTFRAAQLSEQMFNLGQSEEAIEFLGGEFASDILGQNSDDDPNKISKGACENASLIEWPTQCLIPWLSDLPDFLGKLSTIIPDQLGGLSSNFDDFKNPFQSVSAHGEIPVPVAIRVSPEKLKISAGDTVPQKIAVELLDENGDILTTDFSTKISLKTIGSDALRLFSISPGESATAKFGTADFFLVPKTDDVGGWFSLEFSALEISPQKLDVRVTTQKIEAFSEKSEIVADDWDGMKIDVVVQNLEDEISRKNDGEVLKFESEWGTFSDDGTAEISDARASILFFPGKKSGEAEIQISPADPQTMLPPEKIFFDIVPDLPAKISLDSDAQDLVLGGAWITVSGSVQDQFGNPIPAHDGTIQWRGAGLEIQNIDGPKSVRVRVPEKFSNTKNAEKGEQKSSEPNIFQNLRDSLISPAEKISADAATQKLSPEKLTASTEILPAQKFSTEFFIIKNPTFETEFSPDLIPAGTATPQKVSVRAVDPAGNLLRGNYPVSLKIEPADVGIFPQNFTLKNGTGEFEFFAGERAGKTSITLKSLGFVEHAFEFDIAPGDPAKIEISADQKTLNSASTDPLHLSFRVVDRFGNLVPDFDQKISLVLNPAEKISSAAKTDLVDLGVIGDDDFSIKSFLDDEISDSQAEQFSDFVVLDPADVPIFSGEGTANIFENGQTGKGFLVASVSDQNILPATFEFEVTRVLARSDFQTLSPKSQLTMLLGFPGGKLDAPNLGSRFLFDGESQAVATLIANPNAPRLLGQISAQAVVQAANPIFFPDDFFSTNFVASGGKLARARLIFSEPPSLFVGAKMRTKSGVYFSPASEISDFEISDGTLQFQGENLFSLRHGGGLDFASNEVSLYPIEKSILKWTVLFRSKKIGELEFHLENFETKIVDEFSTEILSDAIEILATDPDVSLQKIWTGASTAGESGVGIFSKKLTELQNRSLGGPQFSAEDVDTDRSVGWESAWKPGPLFSAGASIGRATQWGASDAVILLGDPSLSVQTENTKSSLGISPDLGVPLWKSSAGAIDQILIADVNRDARAEILTRVGKNIFALYHSMHELDNFRDMGPILRFEDGVRDAAVYPNSRGELLWLIQVNDAGELIFHRDFNGKFSREKINLGLENEILKIVVAQLNGDKFQDLVILDETNTLHFAYGRELPADEPSGFDVDANGFFAAQRLDQFAPSFEKIEENYDFAAQQNLDEDYFGRRSFPQLSTILASFDGVENSTFTDEIQQIAERNFARISENKKFDAQFSLELSNAKTTIEPGDTLEAKLEIFSTEKLEDFTLWIPDFVGMNLNADSISVDLSNADLKFTAGRNGFLLGISEIPLRTRTTFSWEFSATSVPPITFSAYDFSGNDGIDDIAVAWEIDDEKKLIQFLSDDPPRSFPTTGKSSDATEDSPGSIISETHTRKIVDAFGENFPSDFDAEAQAADIVSALQGFSNNSDGIPVHYQTADIDESLNQSSCGSGCGLPIPSYAFLAPGAQSLYLPPISFPMPPLPGTPVLWVGATPPFVGAGPMPTSQFRLYVMPTTTAQVALGFCLNPNVTNPTMIATGVPFPDPSTCFVVVPPLLELLGACPGNFLDLDLAAQESRKSLQPMFAAGGENLGSFIPRNKAELKNKQIAAADIITTWVQKQMREFSNIRLPSFEMVLPAFPKTKKSATQNSPSGANGADETGYRLLEDPSVQNSLAKIESSPFVQIKKREVAIPYPQFSIEQIQTLKSDFSTWKKDFQIWKHETKKSIRRSECELVAEGKWDAGEETADGICEESTNLIGLDTLIQLKKIETRAQFYTEFFNTLLDAKQSLDAVAAPEKKLKIAQTTISTAEKTSEISTKKSLTASAEKQLQSAEKSVENSADQAARSVDNLDEAGESVEALAEILSEFSSKINADETSMLRDSAQTLLASAQSAISLAATTAEQAVAVATEDLENSEKLETQISAEWERIAALKISFAASESEKENIKKSRAERKAERENLKKEKKKKLAEEKEKRKLEKPDLREMKNEGIEFARKMAAKELMKQLLAVDVFIDKVEEMMVAVDKNVQAIESYRETGERIQELPQEFKKLFKQIEETNFFLTEYWENWIKTNKRSVSKWQQFEQNLESMYKLWESIPDIFRQFTKDCGTCPVNRGTMEEWLMRVLLGKVKLPVIPAPQIPDVTFDLSRVAIGTQITVPDIVPKPVEFSVPKLPGLPGESVDFLLEQFMGQLGEQILKISITFGALKNLVVQILDGSFTASIPAWLEAFLTENFDQMILDLLASLQIPGLAGFIQNIPEIPILPSLPAELLNLDFNPPPVSIPTLPTLIEPPKLPDFLEKLQAILVIPKTLLKFFCLLNRGLLPIPEWKVATQVVAMTNRTSLMPLDFVSAALSPALPSPPSSSGGLLSPIFKKMQNAADQLPEDFSGVRVSADFDASNVTVKMESKFVPALEMMNDQIDQVQQKMSCVLDQLDAQAKGAGSLQNCSGSGAEEMKISRVENLENRSNFFSNANSERVSLFSPGENPRSPELEKSVDWLQKFLAYSLENSDSDFEIPEMKNALADFFEQPETWARLAPAQKSWLASTEFIDPSKIPTELPTDFDVDEQLEKTRGMTSEPKMYFFDSEQSLAEEITPVSLDGKSYTATISDLDLDGEKEIFYAIGSELYFKRRVDFDFTSEQSDAEFEAPTDRYTFWEFEKFVGNFTPTFSAENFVDASGTTFKFQPPWNKNLQYFEWVISDRPDHIFERGKISSDRAADEWRRIAFLIRPRGTKYDIRRVSSLIRKITGAPILYGSKIHTIQNFTLEECENSEIEKPFFPTETVFVGVAPHTRMVIKTLPRDGQQAERREIDLRAGEETIVDFAEVCATFGEAQYAEPGKIEKLEVRENGYFIDNMRLELGKNDEVQLDLFDETPITIEGGETYEMHHFTTEDSAIAYFKKLNLGNHYGSFVGFDGRDQSFSVQKLLHDPQPADDTVAPQISLLRGKKRTEYFGEPIEIDATRTIEEQAIDRVWWEFDGAVILDTADQKKFPEVFQNPQRALKIQIPAREKPEKVSFILHVTDLSGNEATATIEISLESPPLRLLEVSQREGRILGKLLSKIENLEISFSRERNDREIFLPKTVTTDAAGMFELGELSAEGNVEILDQNKNLAAAILPTGRVILENKNLTISVQSATEISPQKTEIRDTKNQIVAEISIAPSGENSVEILSGEKIDSKKFFQNSAVQALDRNLSDSIRWEKISGREPKFSGAVALVDSLQHETLGVLDRFGNFHSLQKNLSLRPKRSVSISEPVVFEILNEKVLGEFFVPVEKNVTVSSPKKPN